MRAGLALVMLVAYFLLVAADAPPPAERDSGVFFSESFDDARLIERGWYDGGTFVISSDSPYAGAGCIEYGWREKGGAQVVSSAVRHLFEPTETVYLRFYIRLSPGWGWSGRDYHPHLTHFMTTENRALQGPAATHLTLYIEPVAGRLRLGTQDRQNKDTPHGLTQGPLLGGYNGRAYDSAEVLFVDDKWHSVEAFFKLNSVNREEGTWNADGVAQGWFDGELVVDEKAVVFRSIDFPDMKFNQFLLAPYFGPGLVPHAQRLWIDELAIGVERPAPAQITALQGT